MNGRLMRKSQRQEASASSSPPARGPMIVAIAPNAVQVPIAAPRSDSGKVAAITASELGVSSAPATPARPRRGQQSDRRRGGAEQRGESEACDADGEDATLAEDVAQRAAHEDQRAERQQVCAADPLLSRQAAAEAALDRRQGDVDDRSVEQGDRGAEDRGGQRQLFDALRSHRGGSYGGRCWRFGEPARNGTPQPSTCSPSASEDLNESDRRGAAAHGHDDPAGRARAARLRALLPHARPDGRPQAEQLPLWERVVEGDADWEAIFEDSQSSCDFPASRYYRELLEIYPDAKVLLSVRSAEGWVKSMRETIWPMYFGDSVMHHVSAARRHRRSRTGSASSP